jgi:hypothetical protein
MMKNYSVTVGYKAVIDISVKANSEKEAREFAKSLIGISEKKFTKVKGVEINDSSYDAHGVVDMDATWNMVQS